MSRPTLGLNIFEFASRGIFTSLFADGVPASLFLPAAASRARLYRSHQRIVSRVPPMNLWPTLGSMSPIRSSNYVYLLQFSGKMLALVGAAATLLDAVATSTVSAATASAYLSAEIRSIPISMTVLTVLFLVALGVLALAGIRESASATAAVFVFHARFAFSQFHPCIGL